MSAIRLAIVGSTSLDGNEAAVRAIAEVLDRYKPDAVVSGGAVGIDSMAAQLARARGIPVTEHLPRVPRWGDGFKPRNLLIAHDCTHLVRIVAAGSKTYGSGWTRDRAKENGAAVEEIVL